MDVRAIYEFPVAIWVTCATLGRTYSTGYGDLKFDIALPNDDPPLGSPPVELAKESSPSAEEGAVWARQYGAFIPESLRPATAVHRVAVTAVEGPKYDDHRSWFTPNHQLAEFINRWFDDVRTWVEIMTGQDLDPNHRVYDAELVGTGLTFIQPEHQDALGLTITTPHVRPLRPDEWATILLLARGGKEPPLEEVLSRDARAARRRDANRRAIIDAATAVEIALGRLVRNRSAELLETQKRRITERTALGGYISIAENSGLELAVPFDKLRQLNTLRNDAAHRGQVPEGSDVATAVQVMIDFLGAHGRYRRRDERESDGGELILVEVD